MSPQAKDGVQTFSSNSHMMSVWGNQRPQVPGPSCTLCLKKTASAIQGQLKGSPHRKCCPKCWQKHTQTKWGAETVARRKGAWLEPLQSRVSQDPQHRRFSTICRPTVWGTGQSSPVLYHAHCTCTETLHIFQPTLRSGELVAHSLPSVSLSESPASKPGCVTISSSPPMCSSERGFLSLNISLSHG